MNKSSSPDFSPEDVQILLKEYYGLEVSVKPLNSYLDQNFLVIVPTGKKYVFKIANLAENRDVLDLQNKAMQFLINYDLSIASPVWEECGLPGLSPGGLSEGHRDPASLRTVPGRDVSSNAKPPLILAPADGRMQQSVLLSCHLQWRPRWHTK